LSATKFASVEEAAAYALRGIRGSPVIAVPMGKSLNLEIMKYSVKADGTLDAEGFISTPDKDIERDILEPEAFSGEGLTGYMKRGAPVSIEHGTKTLPIGFMHKARLVRNGQVLQDENNPKHPPIDFRHYDGGSGWYGLVNIYDKDVLRGISKGAVSSFSWIGMPNEWDVLPDGGRHFVKPGSVNPILEATVTAYPINPQATMRIAKARGYIPQKIDPKISALLANPLVVDAIISILIPPGKVSAVVEEELKRLR